MPACAANQPGCAARGRLRSQRRLCHTYGACSLGLRCDGTDENLGALHGLGQSVRPHHPRGHVGLACG
eukprot:2181789-Pyramimonas_sp.AAC.1